MADFSLEQQFQGFVVGVDEVGRGPLCGPVVAAAAGFLKSDAEYIKIINDSKKISAKKRDILYDHLISDPNVVSSYAVVSQEIIDEINIFAATKLAMSEAVAKIDHEIAQILVDGNHKMIVGEIPVLPVIKGDSISTSIAAASIIAKVTRDRIMQEYAKEYPEYGWEKNAGYGTKLHLEAINQYGVTKYHRKSFKPISLIVQEKLNN